MIQEVNLNGILLVILLEMQEKLDRLDNQKEIMLLKHVHLLPQTQGRDPLQIWDLKKKLQLKMESFIKMTAPLLGQI
jgi:hypothetical protein